MTFDKAKILAEGGTYHGPDNMLIESAPFEVTASSMVPVAETGNAPTYIKESADLPKRMVIEGVFQRADTKNANGRVYPRKMWESRLATGSNIQKRIAERSMIGHLEHPESGTTDLNKGAILITGAWMESDGTIKGRAIVYNTPDGLRLQEYIATGTKVGISSRGTGTVDRNGVVQEDFQLETWDMVYNPSTPGAHPTLQTESAGQPQVVESTAGHPTVNPVTNEGKPMSLSKQISETRQKVQAMLAIDPAKLDEAGRKKHAADLLDLRVAVAEQFTGEKRVAEVVEILESLDKAKKVAEDVDSGDVGGFRDAPVGGNPVGPAGLDGFKTVMTAINNLQGDAKAAAIKAFDEAAAMIAANLTAAKPVLTVETVSEGKAALEAEAKEILEAARDELVEKAAVIDASAELIEEIVARAKTAAKQVEEAKAEAAKHKAALDEAVALNDKLTTTIAEMTAKAPAKKVEESAPEKKEPVQESAPVQKPMTLAERIAARKRTDESTLPAAGSVVESAKDAAEVEKIDESPKTSPRAAFTKKLLSKVLIETGAAH